MDLTNLPPEMQERIGQIINQAKQPAPPPVKPPSLMDHTIALRQEVAALSQQIQAIGQVVDACGQATGALYQMFQEQTTPTDQGAAYEAPPDF